jgi:hypothetical protein
MWVPDGESYRLVALLSPLGGRVALPDGEPLAARGAVLTADLRIPTPVAPRPRSAEKSLSGVDRFFLSFVEDTALVERGHLEFQFESIADNVSPDVAAGRIVAAFAIEELPRVEFGLRAGFGSVRSGGGNDDSGATDAELWAKLHLARSDHGLWDSAIGALMKLPTGDDEVGLGTDATQAEWFFAASRNFTHAVVVGHIGLASSSNGALMGQELEGRLALSSGLGVLVPLNERAGVLFEASHDGARFEHLDDASMLLAGFNWQLQPGGKLRAALATGLADASPDLQLTAGYAFVF